MKPLLRRAIPLVLVSTAVNAFAGSATWKQFPVSNNWNLANNWSFIAGIYNIAEPVASGIKPVYINSTGQLGTTPPASSRRFKEAIKPMDKSSEAILGLTPVTFRYKSDSESTPQFGLIAEEVAKVNPDLVVRDDKGEIYTVRYDAVNAMLLNEFLKAHGQIEQQTRRIEELTAPASIANSEGKRRRCTGQICTANDCDETVRPSHQPLLINSGPGVPKLSFYNFQIDKLSGYLSRSRPVKSECGVGWLLADHSSFLFQACSHQGKQSQRKRKNI